VASTTYLFRVASVNSAGTGSYTGEVTFTTAAS
jgi:hypothetical protein